MVGLCEVVSVRLMLALVPEPAEVGIATVPVSTSVVLSVSVVVRLKEPLMLLPVSVRVSERA